MLKKEALAALLLLNLIVSSVSVLSSGNNQTWWNKEWSFNKEIYIPIDTSDENTKFQPIDIQIDFENSCWAENEKDHSIRVILQDGETLKELESQIYDLVYGDNDHITACNLVFLIPEEANGMEKYYVYYDEEEKPSPGYQDHVDVEESYYRYEPIPGYSFESRYYKITEDGYIVYAVAQEGECTGKGTTQQATKLKTKTKEVMPQNGEVCASFEFWYYYGQGIKEYSSTIEQLISKEIFVDGNLMVEFGIVSGTSREDMQTSVIYKYYYCPTENKRLCTHVRHKTLQECNISPGTNFDGVYTNLQCGGMKSNAIEELNFGEILPYLHVYAEPGILREYALDPDPRYVPDDWNIRVLNTEHDVDLGDEAWACFDKGETGVAHALILGSNSVVTSGTDERDGVQVKAHESDYLYLPGFVSDTAIFQYGRNSYEKGSSHDLKIPDDFVVEFDAEFFSTENGGYRGVQREAGIFQSLAKIRPVYGRNVSGEDIEEDKYLLTAYIHLAPSFPMGYSFSALTGKNFSYITAELYSEGIFISSDVGRRLSINPSPSFEDTNLIEKIRLAIGMFDWKELTFFKKIRFQNLPPGRYLVKIYKENPLFGKERRYIGFQTVDVTGDTKKHIFCKPEGKVSVSVFDQHNDGVEDIMVWLLSDNMVIAAGVTDQNGLSTINAPCNFLETYVLKIVYKGFVIHEESIRFGCIRNLIPAKKSITIELYDVTLNVTDTWGLTPEIELNPVITRDKMEEPVMMLGEKISEGKYRFSSVYRGAYHLVLAYKSFVLEKNMHVPAEKEMNLVFPAEYLVKAGVFDSRGNKLSNVKIQISRASKKIIKDVDEHGFSSFLLPPGVYISSIYHDGEIIGTQKITIFGGQYVELLTANEPNFPLIIIAACGIVFLSGIFLALRKKDIVSFFMVLAIVFAIISIVSPWWILDGSSSIEKIETSTKMFLLPVRFVTLTITTSITGGEIVYPPDIFLDVMSFLPILIAISCILAMTGVVFKKLGKKQLSWLLLFTSILFMVGVIAAFTYGMSQLSEIIVGSFFGSGNQGISIPGEGIYQTLYCSWGPSTGFYLCVLSTIMTLFVAIIGFRTHFKNCKFEKEKNLHYEMIKKYFRKDAVEKRGYYNNKSFEEIGNNLKKRTMWKIYNHSLDEVLQKNHRIKNVIDVGCGIGNFTYELTKRQKLKRIIGLDFLKDTFNIPLGNIEKFEKVSFVQGDLLNLPFNDKSFDLTVCLNVLHHIHADDFSKAIQELARITDKYLIIEIRNKKNIFDFWYNIVVMPKFYRELPMFASSIDDVSNLLKDYDYKLQFVRGRMVVNWACRRFVLVYKKI